MVRPAAGEGVLAPAEAVASPVASPVVTPRHSTAELGLKRGLELGVGQSLSAASASARSTGCRAAGGEQQESARENQAGAWPIRVAVGATLDVARALEAAGDLEAGAVLEVDAGLEVLASATSGERPTPPIASVRGQTEELPNNDAVLELSGEHDTPKEQGPELIALQDELGRVRSSLLDHEHHDALQDESSLLVSDANALADDDSGHGEDAALVFRVGKFQDGVYRGQAKLEKPHDDVADVLDTNEPEMWVPHGFGVLTAADGCTRCGEWHRGVQVNCGTLQTAALTYEGECRVVQKPHGVGISNGSMRHGVGFYAFGALFVGCWSFVSTASRPSVSATTETCRPNGLGRLLLADPSVVSAGEQQEREQEAFGWFRGLRCVQSCSSDVETSASSRSSDCDVRVPVAAKLSFQQYSQPERGLLVADAKLISWRLAALARGMSRWRHLSCMQSVAKASHCRLLALEAQQRARKAEKTAVEMNLELLCVARRQEAAELLEQVAAAREVKEHGRQLRQLHAQRLAMALEQRELARACVTTQQSAVELLEQELDETVELLGEATQAQDDCARCARELHVLKRQIENASVKLNAMRQAMDPREVPSEAQTQLDTTGLDSGPSSRSQRSMTVATPPTPASKTPRWRRPVSGASVVCSRSQEGDSQRSSSRQQFVCDVPGCACGIPRDVFLRVAAALNGE